MRTLGIDVASKAARTAICSIRWGDGSARIEPLTTGGATDLEIRSRIERADRVGLDIPLGWPSAFVDAVVEHHHRRPWTASVNDEGMQALRLRETDRWITATARRPSDRSARCHPMSVSTNLIAIPAMRIAALLGPCDRSGEGHVVEVYPAAALFVWDLPYRGYKGPGAAQRAVRTEVVRRLREKTPWLIADAADWHAVGESDHVLDALIASLIARAKHCGLCVECDDARSDRARREGWIALPLHDALSRLASGV
ncbi:MAG: DUF429 domain-containing protein [Candidatus Dormiibacterota bacterium]